MVVEAAMVDYRYLVLASRAQVLDVVRLYTPEISVGEAVRLMGIVASTHVDADAPGSVERKIRQPQGWNAAEELRLAMIGAGRTH